MIEELKKREEKKKREEQRYFLARVNQFYDKKMRRISSPLTITAVLDYTTTPMAMTTTTTEPTVEPTIEPTIGMKTRIEKKMNNHPNIV